MSSSILSPVWEPAAFERIHGKTWDAARWIIGLVRTVPIWFHEIRRISLTRRAFGITLFAREILVAKKRLILVGVCCAMATSGAMAQCQTARLIAGDTVGPDENFGTAVAMSGGVLIVGAKQARLGNVSAGAAYIYRKSGSAWTLDTRLMPTPASFKSFGTSVAIDGDTAVIGAPDDSPQGVSSGSVYIYRSGRGGWVQEAKLLSPDGAATDHFGLAVAISGDLAVVGVPFKSDVGTQAGSAYVFERVGGVWSAGTRIDSGDGVDAGLFGSGVACSREGGGLVIIGAINKNTGSGTRGAVYIFRKAGQGWVRDSRLTPSDAAIDDGFGTFVSLSGSALLVGAYGVDGAVGVDQGAAYVFREGAGNTWTQEAKLFAKDAAPGDLFGSAGYLSGDAAVVGAYRVMVGGLPSAGAAYMFKRNGAAWAQSARVQASDPHAGDCFGVGAATNGVDAAFGSQFLDGAQPNSGAIYVYSAAACACYANCDGSTATPVLNANDFNCFLNNFASGNSYANCDGSTLAPILNANDFNCFLNTFATGCS